jgi:hypothetical protein
MIVVLGPACVAHRSPASVSPDTTTPVATTTGCAGCHVREASEWQTSMHHEAFTNAFFRVSYEEERLAFCVGCHAPSTRSADGDSHDAISRRDAPGATRGIDCTDCHGTGDAPRSTRSRAIVQGSPPMPHRVTVDPSFGTSSCARCHEFTQPNAPEALQSTISEHRRSDFAAASCADCHMAGPRGKSVDHRFLAGVRNIDRLRAAVRIEVHRKASERVEVSIGTVGVGHALPTGDLFRRLRLDVEVLDDHGRIDDQMSLFFGRTFRFRGGVRANVDDRRISVERRESVLLPFPLGNNARFRLHYERGLTDRGGRMTVGDSTLLIEDAIP